MGSKHDEVIDSAQPALIVTYGNTAKKRRALDRDVLLLGRAHACDIGLDAIGVLPVHCVITRRQQGFYIRNCAGHGGTRLNGESIFESPLHDADALQIGPFSFQVHIPPESLPKGEPPASEAPNERHLRHLLRSRRHLARLALAHRRRVRLQNPNGSSTDSQKTEVERQAVLDQREKVLQRQVEEHEQRVGRLREEERRLAAEREAFDRANQALKARVQEVENHLAHRKATVEADLQARKREFQLRCQEEERAAKEQRRQATPDETPSQEEVERLEIRARELEHFAEHLQRTEQRLKQEAERLARSQPECSPQLGDVQRARDQIEAERKRWEQERTAEESRLAEQRHALAQTEAILEERREEVSRIAGRLNGSWQAIVSQGSPDPQAAQHEIDLLRQAVAEHEQQLQAANQQAAELEQRWQKTATEWEGRLQSAHEELQEKKSLLEQLQATDTAKSAGPTQARDIEGYEEELNEFRRQLDEERRTLDEEKLQLQERKAELDDAVRETELELSRDRAQIARDRIQLERMREEIRMEQERLHRDSEVHNRLASLQRLREPERH